MENTSHLAQYGFIRYIGERKLARFYLLILIGLAILYLATFPFFKAPILVTIPAIAAGWFYYRRGGVVASLLAITTNLLLINKSLMGINGEILFQFTNSILFDHIFVILASIGIGYLREIIESRYQTDKQLLDRERNLVLINMATKDILGGGNLKDTYYRLLTHLTNLFVADYASLSHWDKSSQKILLVAATKAPGQPYRNMPLEPEEEGMSQSVLENGHIVFIDDLQKSSAVVRLPEFKTLHPSTQSVVFIPLTTKDYKFGVVTLAFDSLRHFSHEEIDYIELTSYQITLALRSIHQERKIEKQLREAKTLANIEHALSTGERTGVDTVLQLIVDAAKEMIPNTQRVVLHLLDEERRFLVPRAVAGQSDSGGATGNLNMLSGEGIAGQVIATGEVATIADIRNDPNFKNEKLARIIPLAHRSAHPKQRAAYRND